MIARRAGWINNSASRELRSQIQTVGMGLD
jgi:hypothetical protein